MIAPPPHTIVYDSAAIVHELVFPLSGRGLSPSRGALRIDSDSSLSGMLTPGDNAPYRVSKVFGYNLLKESVPQMVATLKGGITRDRWGSGAHLVAIDEVMPKFSNHWNNGLNFSRAMKILNQPSPYGGTWASRVEVFVSPSILIDISNGGSHSKMYSNVMPALVMAGGVHLEMFHGGKRPLRGFSATLWHQAPTAFLRLFKHYAGKANRVHFVFTATTKLPGVPKKWGNPMEASWNLARSTAVNREILANGPDAYGLKTQASTWMKEYNRNFH